MKCIESNVNEDHTLSVRYFHPGNSGRQSRSRSYSVRRGQTQRKVIRVSPYVAVATVRDRTGVVVGTGESVCSERDTPNRALGRRIAVGRALAEVSGRG